MLILLILFYSDIRFSYNIEQLSYKLEYLHVFICKCLCK